MGGNVGSSTATRETGLLPGLIWLLFLGGVCVVSFGLRFHLWRFRRWKLLPALEALVCHSYETR